MPDVQRPQSRPRACAVEGCERGGTLRRGWCSTHYARWWRTGDPGPAESLRKPHVTAHGTINEYGNYGCRCDQCRAAAAEYQKAYFAQPCSAGCGRTVWRRRSTSGLCKSCAQTIPLEERHGTETGYSKGCRCRECRDAAAAARRLRRTRERELIAA